MRLLRVAEGSLIFIGALSQLQRLWSHVTLCRRRARNLRSEGTKIEGTKIAELHASLRDAIQLIQQSTGPPSVFQWPTIRVKDSLLFL